MQWTFTLKSDQSHRLLSRVLQVVEGQRVHLCSFSGLLKDGMAVITFDLDTTPDKAYRIQALLHRVEGVTALEVGMSSS